MPAGRPHKPTILKVITGTDRPHRANRDEPLPGIANPEPPISVRGSSRRVWRWLAPMLIQLRVLTDADWIELGLGCDAMSDYLAYRATILKEGAVYQTLTATGETMIRPRPEVAMASDAWRRADHIFSAFGLNPSARAKVKAQAEEVIDPMEAFLSRGRPD
jgi:P27 family predicted phage terminase small subunit